MRRGDSAGGVCGDSQLFRGEPEQLRRRLFALTTVTESSQTPAGLGLSGPLASRASVMGLAAVTPPAAEEVSVGTMQTLRTGSKWKRSSLKCLAAREPSPLRKAPGMPGLRRLRRS
mmetsp:Transcript_126792/g.370644  ORF Transcript_126792/g.370644 Transcript_126792/m.370644 type:complete len:116 (+) Transcript_126792:1486-1833(+)